MQDSNKDLLCQHYTKTPTQYICIPLIQQTGLFGLLCIAKETTISSHQYQFAITFSEVIKLALANIQLREALQEHALHDTLTGLFNRRYLEEFLPREMMRILRAESHLCVAMLDIDHFKKFNDTYGHEAGDEVLRFIAFQLKHYFRGNDIACRFGGEEFILVMLDTTLVKSLPHLESLCNKIRNASLTFEGKPLAQVTVSIGVSQAPDHGKTMEHIIKSADEALYKAKQTGRDKVVIYSSLSTKP